MIGEIRNTSLFLPICARLSTLQNPAVHCFLITNRRNRVEHSNFWDAAFTCWISHVKLFSVPVNCLSSTMILVINYTSK